jgi:hypothetical protein
MFSYTSAISKKWLAIVFHGLKLGNIRNPFGHSSELMAVAAYSEMCWISARCALAIHHPNTLTCPAHFVRLALIIRPQFGHLPVYRP